MVRRAIPIQVWHMEEVMLRDFTEHHVTQVPITENQLGTMQMIEDVSDHMGMSYPETLDSRYVAQSVDDFIFLGKRDLWRTQLPAKRMRGSLSQEIQSANHHDNHHQLNFCKLVAIIKSKFASCEKTLSQFLHTC